MIAKPHRDVSLDYLRATLTLMVVAHHSCLAYTTFARRTSGDYLTWSAPVVDPAAHSLFFDYAENFNDVFFMSLMFLISGLFIAPALRRSAPAGFVGQRLLRLGLPFLVGMIVLTPLAYWGAWRAAGHEEGLLTYWRLNVTQHGWPTGPLWFIWLLLAFDIIAAALYPFLPAAPAIGGGEQPARAFALLLAASGLAYLPLLAAFGFGRWTALLTPPFYFQVSRILLYFVWFSAGAVIGARDLEKGFLARDGKLARHWLWWVIACFVAYNLLVFAPRILPLTPHGRGDLEAALWVLSCTASSFAFLALFRGVVRQRRAWMDSLARSAYAIYLVHYVFVLWTQYALLAAPLSAAAKFLATFAIATSMSWITAQALLRIPGAQRVI